LIIEGTNRQVQAWRRTSDRLLGVRVALSVVRIRHQMTEPDSWKSDLRVPVKVADRVFLSCAIEKNAELISWDDNLARNASAFGKSAQTPDAYMKTHERKK
jgi:predicted nucleic acid-binding protein